MLKGDLSSTPLAPLLLDLANEAATGCLVITDTAEDEALVYLKNGLVYSVSVPGSRPQLGAKLVSSGALAPEALAEALEAQRTELQGWRLGELLVHLGYVDQPVVEAFVAEQVSEALWDLLRWSDGRWKFRKNVKAREDVGPPMTVVDLLETLRERGYEWETISAVVHGPGAVPRLSTRGDATPETTLDNDAWSMLCKIDGERSVADLAADCGYTLFEAGHVIVSLVQAGLVDIDEDIDVEGSELYGATTLSSAFAGELDEAGFTPAEAAEEDALSKLARLVTEVAGAADDGDTTVVEPAEPAAVAPVAPAQREESDYANAFAVSINRHASESFAASIARVSGALSEVLGEVPPPDIDTEELAARRRRVPPATEDPEWQRRKRLRTAAAAELASAQALIETLRPDHDGAPASTPEFTGDVPKLLSRATERERAAAREAEDAARHAEEVARHAAEEAAREAAEQFARAAAEEAARLEAEQEAARLAAEQAAAEQAAADEAARLEAEQEAARLEAEQEAARLEAEQAAAEQAAAAEAARLAAEVEAAAAAEAARVQAEREAAEEVAWAEYWQREEAERAAAEAEVQAAAELEAQRLAAEEAERQAQAEAERLAAEAETERLAAEEAERQAAEAAAAAEREAQAEADRLAAEESDRQAAEAAEQEAAEAKAEAAARRKAEKEAAAEAAQREDEAAAAAALLAEFAASSADEVPAADPAPEPAPAEVAEAEVREPVSVGGGWSDADSTDTAALLRELSSLGGDEERDAPSGPMPPARQRPATADKKAKKKIGLFGL